MNINNDLALCAFNYRYTYEHMAFRDLIIPAKESIFEYIYIYT